MARHLIQNAATGETRIVGTSALPFFPGFVVLDTLDDGLPPFSFPTVGEADLRYLNLAELDDPESPGSVLLRAAFVPVLRPAGSGDQTALINAALAAAAGGDLRLVGSFPISAPLRIPSDTAVDFDKATITLTAGSNGNMLQNMAVQSNRRLMDAVIAAGSATLTSTTAAFAAGDVGKAIRVQGAGPGGTNLDTTISAVTNATTATLAASATAAVNGQYAYIGGRDKNITVRGGHWVREVNNNARGKGWDSNTIRFRHVDGLTVIGVRLTVKSGKYALNVGDVTDFKIERTAALETSSDVVHVNGPARDGVIRDTFSRGSGDDIVSLTGGDFVVLDSMGDTGGSITDVVIDGIRTYPSTHANHYTRALTIVAGQSTSAAHPFQAARITARNISSQLKANPVAIGSDTQDVGTTGGSYADILIDGLVNEPPAAGAPSQLVLLRDQQMSNIEIRNIRGTGTFNWLLVGTDATVNGLVTVGIPRANLVNAGTVTNARLLGLPSYPTPGSTATDTVPRALLRKTDQVQLVSGVLYLSFFRVESGISSGNIGEVVGDTGAAGATLAKKALYRLNADGSLTLLRSFSAGTLWSTPNVSNGPHAWSGGAQALDPFTTFAIGDLFVGTTPPKLAGIDGVAAELGKGDLVARQVTGQTDTPATIAAGSLAASSFRIYHRLTA